MSQPDFKDKVINDLTMQIAELTLQKTGLSVELQQVKAELEAKNDGDS